MQGFLNAGLFDVTFFRRKALETCLAWRVEKANDPISEGVKYLSSESWMWVPLIVHMYNPFVETCDVQVFLQRYRETASGERTKVYNVYGTFNGQRKFWVTSKMDEEEIGGIYHPLSPFYRQQPGLP